MLLLRNNKYFRIILFSASVVLFALFIVNLQVSYNQGINYEYKMIKIPLYLKIIDFYSRHYHYKDTVKEITVGSKSDEEKIFKLFKWTHENIRRIPQGFPIVDDHVWHIMIRGYGVDDQFHDVFTTLCNYAQVKAFFTWIKSNAQKRKIPLSFVQMKGRWCVFDPFYGVYFRDKNGNLVDIETIKSGNYLLAGRKDAVEMDYSSYIDNLPSVKDRGLTRANTQSPLNRLFLEFKKMKDKVKGG